MAGRGQSVVVALTAAGAGERSESAGLAEACIGVESHGRDAVDAGRTVGWLTAVYPIHVPSLAPARPAVAPPPIRYARTRDGVNIAYSVTGEGLPLVRVLGWFTHIGLEWRWEALRRFWESLGELDRAQAGALEAADLTCERPPLGRSSPALRPPE